MTEQPASPSPRQVELREAAYRYALEHGLADLSLRPLAAAIGSSPRVLMFLFGNKDGLVKALLARAREDELAVLDGLTDPAGHERGGARPDGLVPAAEQIWSWLREPRHRPLLRLWAEAYTRSLIEPGGAWAGFAASTVRDWLGLLASYQPVPERDSAAGAARRTAVLAALRGCLLDLLATGDQDRVDAALHFQLSLIRNGR
jgi:AcrR family transcriptional regulator